MPFRLFSAVVVLLLACSPAGAAERPFARSALLGVWEMVAYESLAPRQVGSPASTPNAKFCFGPREAYPDLAADAANDSADGGGEWWLVGGDILVIRTGVPVGGILAIQLVSVSPEQIVWHRGALRVTLRRVARAWDGRRAPRLGRRSVPVIYPP